MEDILSEESSSSSSSVDPDEFKSSQNVSEESSDDSMTGEFPRGHKRKRAEMEVLVGTKPVAEGLELGRLHIRFSPLLSFFWNRLMATIYSEAVKIGTKFTKASSLSLLCN